MRRKYESPELDIFKFTLVSSVLTASIPTTTNDEDEDDFNQGGVGTIPGGNPFG